MDCFVPPETSLTINTSVVHRSSRDCCDIRIHVGLTLGTVYSRGWQITGDISPWRLNSVRWRLIFVVLQYGTWFMSTFWRLEF